MKGIHVRRVLILAAALALQGCSNFSLFKDSGSTDSAAIAPVPVTPLAPAAPGAEGPLSAAQIKALLTGKSWRWRGPKNSGVTLYASDGTSLVEVTGKGTTQGKWEARDGQLCESFNPAAFLPQGVPMTCQTFTGTNGNYTVGGSTTFQIAS